MKTNKYLAFRRVDITTEVDGYDCYHSNVNGTIGIPTDFVLELTRDEVAELHAAFLLLPIVTKEEIAEALRVAKEEAIVKARQKAEKAAKNKATAAKREAAVAKNREKRERAQLKELQEKYGKS